MVNNDRNTKNKNTIYEGFLAGYLRFVGKTKHNKFCMRTEVFGVRQKPGNCGHSSFEHHIFHHSVKFDSKKEKGEIWNSIQQDHLQGAITSLLIFKYHNCFTTEELKTQYHS